MVCGSLSPSFYRKPFSEHDIEAEEAGRGALGRNKLNKFQAPFNTQVFPYKPLHRGPGVQGEPHRAGCFRPGTVRVVECDIRRRGDPAAQTQVKDYGVSPQLLLKQAPCVYACHAPGYTVRAGFGLQVRVPGPQFKAHPAPGLFEGYKAGPDGKAQGVQSPVIDVKKITVKRKQGA